jgi:hypothetical protein
VSRRCEAEEEWGRRRGRRGRGKEEDGRKEDKIR